MLRRHSAPGHARATRVVTARAELGDIQQAVYLVGNAPRSVRLFRVPVYGKTIAVAIRGALSIPDSAIVSGVRRVGLGRARVLE